MNVHKNAKLAPRGRAEIVRRVLEEGQTPKAVATAFGVCERTVRKWVARFRAEGSDGLQDRSSRPHTLRRPTPTAVQRHEGLAHRLPLRAHIFQPRDGVAAVGQAVVEHAAGNGMVGGERALAGEVGERGEPPAMTA